MFLIALFLFVVVVVLLSVVFGTNGIVETKGISDGFLPNSNSSFRIFSAAFSRATSVLIFVCAIEALSNRARFV